MKTVLLISILLILSSISGINSIFEAPDILMTATVHVDSAKVQEKITILSEGRIFVIDQNGTMLDTIDIRDSVQDFAWYSEDTLVYTSITGQDLKISKFSLKTESSKTLTILKKVNVCKIGKCPERSGGQDVPYWYLDKYHSISFEKAIKLHKNFLYIQADNRVIENGIIFSYLCYKINLNNGNIIVLDRGCKHTKVTPDQVTPPKSPRYLDENHKKRSVKVLNNMDMHLSPVSDHIYKFDVIFAAGGYSIAGLISAIEPVSGESYPLHELGENMEGMWDLTTFRFSTVTIRIYCLPTKILYKKNDGVDKFIPISGDMQISRYEMKPGSYFTMKFTFEFAKEYHSY